MFLGPTSLHRHTCVVLLDLTFLPFYFNLTFAVFFHSSVLMHPEHYTDLDNLDTVESDLRHSAKGSNDANDVTHSLTSYEPNDTVVNELVNSQGSLLLHYPVIGPGHRRHYARQAAHRSTPRILRLPQSSRHCPSCSIEQGNLREREMSISQLVLVSRENTYSANSKFSEITQAEKMVDRTGKPVGEKAAQTHKLGPCLMNRDR